METSLPEGLAGGIAMFYACDSLARQITRWAWNRPGCTVRCSFVRLLPEILRGDGTAPTGR